MQRTKIWMALLASAVLLSPLAATADSVGQMYAPDRVGKWYLGGGLGAFWEDSNDTLKNHSGQYGGFFSAGYRLHPNVALEIDAGARLLAPYFGDSTIVWANTIAIVLVALSVGYWLGGKLADRRPDLKSLCATVLCGAILVTLTQLVRVGDRDTTIELAVLDQRRRLRAHHVGHR